MVNTTNADICAIIVIQNTYLHRAIVCCVINIIFRLIKSDMFTRDNYYYNRVKMPVRIALRIFRKKKRKIDKNIKNNKYHG